MVRVLKTSFFVTCILCTAVMADEPSRHDLVVGIDLSYVSVSGYESWTQGSVGKLRHDSNGLVLGRAFLDYEGRLTDTLGATLVLEAYDGDLGSTIDFTEAYLEWRPVPRSANRYRLKLGTFYPRVSLENIERGCGPVFIRSALQQ